MGNLTGSIALPAAHVAPGFYSVVTPIGSQWQSFTNWDRLAAFVIVAALFTVVFWVLTTEELSDA